MTYSQADIEATFPREVARKSSMIYRRPSKYYAHLFPGPVFLNLKRIGIARFCGTWRGLRLRRGENTMQTGEIIIGDALETLRTMLSKSVHCCVTSPPYWGLRDYGTATWGGGDDGCDHKPNTKHQQQGVTSQRAGRSNIEAQRNHNFRETCGKCGAKRIDAQMGLEPTPEVFIARMVELFREVKRVLRDDATLWLNLGDSYNANQGAGFNAHANTRPHLSGDGVGQKRIDKDNRNTARKRPPGLKPKDLCGMPWRVALALQADGWYLRSDIIWHKPNPMPESCTDRPTKAHEYLFLLSKSAHYFYDADAIREPHAGIERPNFDGKQNTLPKGSYQGVDRCGNNPAGRNKRTVWTIPTHSFKGAHFATFPPKLVEPCVLAGCPAQCCVKCGAPVVAVVELTPEYKEYKRTHGWQNGSDEPEVGVGVKRQSAQTHHALPPKNVTTGHRPTCECNAPTTAGTVLDPFFGAGTTGVVACELGRKWIGIELNREYAEMARQRILPSDQQGDLLRNIQL